MGKNSFSNTRYAQFLGWNKIKMESRNVDKLRLKGAQPLKCHTTNSLVCLKALLNLTGGVLNNSGGHQSARQACGYQGGDCVKFLTQVVLTWSSTDGAKRFCFSYFVIERNTQSVICQNIQILSNCSSTLISDTARLHREGREPSGL